MSSLEYKPDPGAVQDAHWTTVYLSMRDASGQIPVNFITHPGVHLTQACFSDGVYDDLPTQTCISDLFATQFRRLVIDLYWDNINRQFNLCPVELPPLAGNSSAGYSVDSSALFSFTATTSSSATLPTTTAASNGTASLLPTNKKRQSSSPTLSVSNSSTSNSTSLVANATVGTSTTQSTSDAAIPTSTGASGGTLLMLGPYKCSVDLNIGSIISLYNDYFRQTSDTISARLHFLDINLHAAAPFTDPSSPAQTPIPGRLAQGDDLVGAQLQSGLDNVLYTPQNLADDRMDLNRSWFRDNYRIITDTAYFHTEQGGRDNILRGTTITTADGWPGEAWLLLTDNRRLLVSWAKIDSQMTQYNFGVDSSTIFNAGDLMSAPSVKWDGSGELTSGCFYQAGTTEVGVSNSSWAMANINSTNPYILPSLAQNMTACGISPVLDMTVGSPVVQNDTVPYLDFVRSAVYGWAPGQPANASSNKNNDDLRCAMLDSNSAYKGYWRVDLCYKYARAACRTAGQPYGWRLSEFSVPFGSASDACPEHSSFDLPRTGLENTYLYREVLNYTSHAAQCGADCQDIMSGIWINFNSLDQPDCWVIDGSNATCPYSDFQAEQQQRNVLIPTIAAIIILVLSVLTILVKCNENRRSRRTRKRGENGWDYEGIPS